MGGVKESSIEQDLIDRLVELKYVFRDDIRDRKALEDNFRLKFEALNHVHLTDGEFARLLTQVVTPDVFQAARMLRQINAFERDDGTPLNFQLVNLKDWCKNDFEVIHQLRLSTDYSYQRYDVLLLLNGLPLVQVELKTLEISPRRAMQQIVEYKEDAGNGYGKTLTCFIQLFIVSNQSKTWYFANNNPRHFQFDAEERFLPVYRWADRDNRKINDLDGFAETFLAKCTLGKTISRYMVLIESEQKLLMMRPYQVYAVKAITECIHQQTGNGYIWHTTGSGKTLTSFKAATLLKDNPDIDKCLFVVDRKDLDRQTREEFNRFQEGCVEENTDTAMLVRRLLSSDYADKVIVTTIQKLGIALDAAGHRNYRERLAPLAGQRIVFIFDECHRSQFGDNHQAIKEFFPRAQLFGFTGTPIFEKNASYQAIEGQTAHFRTTDEVFQQCLHQYTITHAIEDGNVLRFHVDYFKPDGERPPKPGTTVAKRKVVEAILAKHDQATAQRKFNALLATASINDAIEYFDLFTSVQAERLAADAGFRPLRIGCVFSPPANGNPDVQQLQQDLPQEAIDNRVDPVGKQAALMRIIDAYNQAYGTSHRVQEFDTYYKDVQQRIKSQQLPNADLPGHGAEKLDLVIVVDMLLTGFDAKYLNTLYVDKNLRWHGLIQAFSRTNRVLNDTKPYGNILDFRGQQGAVDEAVALFSGEKVERPQEIWLVDPAPKVVEKLDAAMGRLHGFLASQGVAPVPAEVDNLKGDAARSQFVNLFKEVQRLATQLDQYTDLAPAERAKIDTIAPPDTLRAFRSQYLETARRLKAEQASKGADTPPEVQQLDFEFVLFASDLIDYDYIMGLIARLTDAAPGKVAMSRDELIGLIASDAKFLDDKDAIAEYIRGLPTDAPLTKAQVVAGFEVFKSRRKTASIASLAVRHGLAGPALAAFVEQVLARRVFDGEALGELLAPLDLGWKERTQKELALMAELAPLLRQLAQGRDIAGLKAYET